jgi:NitT/TauT family transport system substrate-binding protein
MTLMKKLIVVVIVLLILLVGSYFLIQRFSEEIKYTGPVEKITVAAAEYLAGTPIYIAEDQGFFEQNGLDVTIKGYGSGKACGDALIAGEADIATSADNVVVSNSFEHIDLRVIGTISTKQVKELVAKKDKGINSIGDLKGKKIGVTKKSGAEFQFGVFLILNGFSLQDIEIVDLKPPEMMDAISNDEVDAVFVWDPYVYDIKKELGDNAVSLYEVDEFYFVLLTKKSWIENNPEAAKRFLKSVIEAETYIKDNSVAAKKFVKDRFEYESDYIDYSWPKQEFIVTLEQAMLISFEDIARWRIKNNLTNKTEVPNYLNYIYTDALHEVKPEVCTIVH